MANQTLTGCIDFTTGLAKFDQDDCEYSGCLVIGGVHDKQVEVEILTGNCFDTYYGCVIFPGGTFEVVVPDNCCVPGCGRTEFCHPCTKPFGTPSLYSVTIEGVESCPGRNGADVNGEWILPCDGADCCNEILTNDCFIQYRLEIPETVRVAAVFGVDGFDDLFVQINAVAWEGGFVRNSFFAFILEEGVEECQTKHCQGSLDNTLLCSGGFGGTSGTATYEPVCEDCCK